MKKLLLVFLTFTFPILTLSAQTWLWGKQPLPFSNNSICEGTSSNCVTTDNAGNAYVTGYVLDTVNFGPYMIYSDKSGSENTFIVKYDKYGDVKWAQQPVQDYGPSLGIGTSITLDQSANVYITGEFADSLIFPGNHKITNYHNYDAFIAKYDSSGNFLWVVQAKTFNANCSSIGNSIITDNLGDVFISGEFTDSIMFGATKLKCTSYYGCPFVAKYDQNGNFKWAKQALPASGASSGYGNAVTLDASGNAYLTGYFVDSLNFGAFSVTNTSSKQDFFLVKYDGNGNVMWARQSTDVNPTSNTYGYGIAIDGSSDIYVTGDFANTVSFGSQTLQSTYTDVFLTKYDLNGNVLWAKQGYSIGNPENWHGYSVVCDTIKGDGGYLAISSGGGSAPFTLKFGLDTFKLATWHYTSTILLQFDSSGKVQCGDIFSEGAEDDGDGLGISKNGKYAYLFGDLGFYTDTTVFGNDTLKYGNDMAFLARWQSCSPFVDGLSPVQDIKPGVVVYPNPSNGKFVIKTEVLGTKNMIEVYNMLGEKVYTAILQNDGTSQIDISNNSAGIYLYRVLTEKGNFVCAGKIIKD